MADGEKAHIVPIDIYRPTLKKFSTSPEEDSYNRIKECRSA
jgi:hypothetical protein